MVGRGGRPRHRRDRTLSDEEKTARLRSYFAPTENMFTIENQIHMLGRLGFARSGWRGRRPNRDRRVISWVALLICGIFIVGFVMLAVDALT